MLLKISAQFFGGVTSNVLYMLDACYEGNVMDLELFNIK